MCCNVLQCVAVNCSVQCVVFYLVTGSTLHHQKTGASAVCVEVCVALCVAACVAVCCSVLQCVAVCWIPYNERGIAMT